MPVWVVIAVAFVLSVVGAYAAGRSEGGTLAEAAVLREERIGALAADRAASAAAVAISQIKVRNVTNRQLLEREIREVPVYRDCKHSADGLRRINDALTDTRPEPAGSGLVPPASALGR